MRQLRFIQNTDYRDVKSSVNVDHERIQLNKRSFFSWIFEDYLTFRTREAEVAPSTLNKTESYQYFNYIFG